MKNLSFILFMFLAITASAQSFNSVSVKLQNVNSDTITTEYFDCAVRFEMARKADTLFVIENIEGQIDMIRVPYVVSQIFLLHEESICETSDPNLSFVFNDDYVEMMLVSEKIISIRRYFNK